MATESELLKKIDDLTKKNRELSDELRKIRPLARLAYMMSLMEGESQRRHKELVKADRDLEDMQQRYNELITDMAFLREMLKQATEQLSQSNKEVN